MLIALSVVESAAIVAAQLASDKTGEVEESLGKSGEVWGSLEVGASLADAQGHC